MVKTQIRIAVAGVLVTCCGLSGLGDWNSFQLVRGRNRRLPNTTITTPAPTKTAGTVTWAVYRETATLDPIKAFDYPDNGAVALTCDSLVRENPDLTLSPRHGDDDQSQPEQDRFLDGAGREIPRRTSGDLGMTWSSGSSAPPIPRPEGSIRACRPRHVDRARWDRKIQIDLKQPDYWLEGELSSPAGEVVEKAYAEAKGAQFGTVTGGTMCSGPFMPSSWKTGQGVSMVPNPNYWDTRLPRPKLKALNLIGVPDDATPTAGFETGSISGTYPIALSTLGRLEKIRRSGLPGPRSAPMSSSSAPTAGRSPTRRAPGAGAGDRPPRHHQRGIPWRGDRVTRAQGAGDVGIGEERLPGGLERAAGAGPGPRGRQEADPIGGRDRRDDPARDLGPAAGFNTQMLAVPAAAKEIGLNAELVSVSAANYFNFFSNPKVHATVDSFLTINYGDYADPSALYKTIVLANGSQNFSHYNNPQVTSLLEQARGTADPDPRAKLTAEAQKIMTHDLVWIPLAMPNTVVVMHKGITGAPATFQYRFGPGSLPRWRLTEGGSNPGARLGRRQPAAV